VPSIGRAPTPRDYWRAARSGWSDWLWELEPYEREQRCAWLWGSCLLVRGSALAAVGGLDERFFLYSEEVDLCTRARRAGWEVAYWPGATVMHRVADRPFDPHLERLLQWSKLVYMRKWFGPVGRASMRAALAVMYGRRVWRRRREASSVERTRARVQLEAVLRFRPERYGASSQIVLCSSGSSPAPRP
jgi:GT2 family glycosyltransferase